MSILLLCVLIILLSGFRIRKNPTKDYMSFQNTKSLKGFFVLLVILQHLSEYAPAVNGLPSSLYFKFQFYSGQLIVAPFLFLSGFGIATKLSNEGYLYLKTFPQKRILKVLLDFDIAVFVYLLLDMFLKIDYSWKIIVLSLIGWEQIGNSNWFIFVTLVMYIIIYFIFSLVENKNAAIFLTFLSGMAYVWIFDSFDLKPDYFYNTALCFGAGMMFKIIYSYLSKLIECKEVYYGLIIAIPLISYYLLRYNSIIWIFNLIAVLFAVWLCLLNYQFTIKNSILEFFGGKIFEIYILQRIPMILFEAIGVDSSMVYIPMCIISIIVLAELYSIGLKKIHGKIHI